MLLLFHFVFPKVICFTIPSLQWFISYVSGYAFVLAHFPWYLISHNVPLIPSSYLKLWFLCSCSYAICLLGCLLLANHQPTCNVSNFYLDLSLTLLMFVNRWTVFFWKLSMLCSIADFSFYLWFVCWSSWCCWSPLYRSSFRKLQGSWSCIPPSKVIPLLSLLRNQCHLQSELLRNAVPSMSTLLS